MVHAETALWNVEQRDEYLASAAEYFALALSGNIDDMRVRASIAAQAGYALMYLTTGNPEENTARAKQYLTEAEAIFAREGHSEELEEVRNALRNL